MAVYLVGVKVCVRALMFILMFQMSLATLRARRNAGNTISEADEFRIRLQEVQSWNCGTPKPRLVYLRDEYRNLETPSNVWLPNAAVLHRCEQALGCCHAYPTHTCQPSTSQNVSIIFQKYNTLSRVRQYQRLTFTNHTSCGCVRTDTG